MQQLKLRMKLSEALANTGDPTPGYLIEEFSAMTYEGTAECVNLVDSLLKRLKNERSGTVLYKGLRVIRLIAEKGHSTFRRELLKNLSMLRDFTTWSGRSDPMHGDALTQRVRESARAV
eukprot:RCo004507